MIVVLAPPVRRQLQEIIEELKGIRLATERIATALETTEPAREITSIAWHTDVPEEES